jgi:protein SCO1/2
LSVLLVIGLGVGVLLFQRLSLSSHTLEKELVPLGRVPDFRLSERSGREVSNRELQGKVWVAAFIFTRCVDECPLMSNRMARLQQAFAAEQDVRLVSITVDPEHDTPVVLSEYASHFGADPQRWLFLTGDKAAIFRLAREGFYLGVTEPRRPQQSWRMLPLRSWVAELLTPAVSWAHHKADPQDKGQPAVLHSARLVLVDRQGQIRQYYDSREDEALARLQQHIKHLLRGDR